MKGATCTSQLVPLGLSDHVFAIVEVKINKNFRKCFHKPDQYWINNYLYKPKHLVYVELNSYFRMDAIKW